MKADASINKTGLDIEYDNYVNYMPWPSPDFRRPSKT